MSCPMADGRYIAPNKLLLIYVRSGAQYIAAWTAVLNWNSEFCYKFKIAASTSDCDDEST